MLNWMRRKDARDFGCTGFSLSRMAAGGEFLSGEEFDLYFGNLDFIEPDDDEELSAAFAEAVDEIQGGEFKCDECSKTCKSKGGLTRHKNTKHPDKASEQTQSKTTEDITLSETYILQIIDKSRKILETDDCYPSEIRNVFSKASDFVPSASFIVESQKLYKVLYNSGEAEKFYTNFFTIMPLKAEEFFQNINKNAAMLLVLKFADSLIAFEKERVACRSSGKANSPEPSKISDNEKSALQYLGGYVLHNLHKKIRASKKYNSEENQQALSFLRSARTLEDKSQKLVNGLSRGGLWMANYITQAIFVLAEKLFRTETNVQNIKKIDCSSLVTKALNSIETRAKFNLLLEDCSMEVDKKIGLDTLQQIFALYFRVRSFSFTKDIVEKYKNANHKVKSKALSTEIKRSSDKVSDHADQNA